MSASDILLVEDNGEIRDSLRELLELEGFAVRVAEHGEAALAAIAEAGPALVLLDLMMPVMDGWAVLAVLRGGGPSARPALPVVVLSGMSEAAEVAARYGCSALLKPIDVGELLAVAARHAPRGAA